VAVGAFEGALYATATAHHRAHDDAALAGVDLRPGLDVLDLGCGVGDLTLRLWDAVRPGGSVVGLDASASVLATAAARAGERPGLRWVHGRAQDTAALLAPDSADVVVSVAALHWVPCTQQPAVLAGLARVLRPGGVLRVDMGGAGQLAGVVPVLDAVSAAHGGGSAPWCFPTPETCRTWAAEAGFTVERAELVHQRRDLGSADGVSAWLRSQVLPAYAPTVPEPARAAFVAEAVDRVTGHLGGPAVGYVRLHVLARR
jgi:SAM-dependent methyltransferase